LIAEICFNRGSSGIPFVTQSLLPLWGTWVGTIPAFYFGKSNFEAVSKSYQEVIRKLTPEEKIASMKVKDVMIPFDKIVALTYEKDKDRKLEDILNIDDFKQRSRYAIFHEDGVLAYIIHRSEFTCYISDNIFKGRQVDEVKAATLEKFIHDGTNAPETPAWITAVAFVPATANLLEAKQAMDAVKKCHDVFVTLNGEKTEQVLGLITNTMILEHSKV
jgi:CBS domain containing-hemolysin-like protein